MATTFEQHQRRVSKRDRGSTRGPGIGVGFSKGLDEPDGWPMPFERHGWTAEKTDAGTRRWVYIARDGSPGTIQRGTVRIDPNVDADETDPVNMFGSGGVEQMEAAAQECLEKVERCLRDRAKKGPLSRDRK